MMGHVAPNNTIRHPEKKPHWGSPQNRIDFVGGGDEGSPRISASLFALKHNRFACCNRRCFDFTRYSPLALRGPALRSGTT